MDISKEEARKKAESMVKESGKNLRIIAFESVHYIDGDGLFFFSVQDRNTGRTTTPANYLKRSE